MPRKASGPGRPPPFVTAKLTTHQHMPELLKRAGLARPSPSLVSACKAVDDGPCNWWRVHDKLRVEAQRMPEHERIMLLTGALR